MSRKIITGFAALALAAVPMAGAQAKGPDGQRAEAKPERTTKPPRVKKVAYQARGVVASVDVAAGTLTVSVADRGGATNRAARVWRGKDVTFTVTGSRLKVRDTNGDGKRDLADVAAGDKAKVLAKLPRRLGDDAGPYAAKRITVKRPAPKPVEDDAETPEETPAAPPAS